MKKLLDFMKLVPRQIRGVFASLFLLCMALGGAIGDPSSKPVCRVNTSAGRGPTTKENMPTKSWILADSLGYNLRHTALPVDKTTDSLRHAHSIHRITS
jgi:hypothetical protein